VEQWTGRVDVFHETDFVLPPTRAGTKTLLTVHDLSFVRVPESANPSLKAYLDAVVPRSARRADHILADSQTTKDDLMALYGIPADKTTVLLSGVNPRFEPSLVSDEQRRLLRKKYGIGDVPFVLAVGTVQPRKNYERLIRAMAALPPALADVKLVIAGGKGWLDAPIYRTVDELNMRERVIFTGFLDDTLLPALYKLARCLAFPSLYEGFGLPILEAMACGTPVVTANVSSTAEVAGQATLLIDPLSVDQIRDALIALLTDEPLRGRLIAAGFAQAAQFTWSRAARQLRDIYARLLE
jgi:glycosyltransferase involved in cell wall biosynthesis